jgi:hypothetical protein
MSETPPPGDDEVDEVDEADEPPTPAELRLAQVLSPLREDPPQIGPGTALAVVARARWQGPLRSALHTAGRLVSAVGDVVGLALARHRRGGPSNGGTS